MLLVTFGLKRAEERKRTIKRPKEREREKGGKRERETEKGREIERKQEWEEPDSEREREWEIEKKTERDIQKEKKPENKLCVVLQNNIDSSLCNQSFSVWWTMIPNSLVIKGHKCFFFKIYDFKYFKIYAKPSREQFTFEKSILCSRMITSHLHFLIELSMKMITFL